MASIKGIELKSLKKFVGREGEAYQGNIYMNGKKVGFFSQDGNGGSARVDYVSKEISTEIKAIAEQYFKENPSEYNYVHDDEDFFNDLVELALDEKAYKAAIKKGYAMVFLASANHEEGLSYLLPQLYSIPANLTTPVEMNKLRKELVAKGYNKFVEYKSLDDFIK